MLPYRYPRLFVALITSLAFMLPTHAAQVVRGHVPEAAKKLKALGPLTTNQMLTLSIGLPVRNQPALTALIKALYDPASPQFHHFITPAEFTSRFGPTQADYDTLKAFAKSQGFHVTGEHANRMVLDVAGDVPTIQKSFHVRMQVFPHPTHRQHTFYAPNTEPSLDLSVPVLHISGLDNYDPPHPLYKIRTTSGPLKALAKPQSGSASGGGYAGNDFRNAYVPGSSLTGTGQSVGLLEFDGYYSNDITAYETTFARSNIPLVNVPVDGGIGSPGSANVEVALDIEMAIAMAPNLAAVYVYEAPNSTSEWDSILSRMANDNLAKQLSCSWGGGGPDATAEQIFQQMATQGQSFFVASGDSDAYTGAVPFPADSPSITVVGGTTLSTASAGGAYSSETVWNWGFDPAASGDVGSSGGISTYYAIPSYQQSVSMASNQGSTTMRNLPDVAMTADNIFVNANNGGTTNVGGTSCAAPLWAGFMALANQQALSIGHATAGFVNPAIYTIGQGSSAGTMIHDVVTGNNFSSGSPSKFAAATGFDLCTGWGSPAGSALINQLVGTGTSAGSPVIESPTQERAYYNQSFGYEIMATNSPTSFTASNLPGGLSINTSTGFISGAPTSQGTFVVPITATNSQGTGTANLTITIQQAPVPQITSPLTASATNNVYFGYQIRATNNPVSFGASGLPTGLIIDTPSGEIYGTPTVTGTFNVTISASNSGATGSAVLVLTVAPPTAPIISAPLVNLDTFPTDSSVASLNSGLILGPDGNYYGTSYQGGSLWGTVFKMTPAGAITILHTFTGGSDGRSPSVGLTIGPGGNFYGETALGGTSNQGTIFEITPQGVLTTLVNFNQSTNGYYPEGGLLYKDGNFYGSTIYGVGSNNYLGTLFKMTPSGTLTTLVQFNTQNGQNPSGPLIAGSDGYIYGTTGNGGSNGGWGTIFKMKTDGTLTTLYSFSDSDGWAPDSLMQLADGTFYGTNNQGGLGLYGGCGTIFKMTPSGTLTNLHYFAGPDGIYPSGPLQLGADGNFYGVTEYGGNPSNVPGGNNVGNGTVFSMTPSGDISTLTAFTYLNGRVPIGPLVADGEGNYIGATASGGAGNLSGGYGTIYKITPFFANLSVGSAYSYQITASNTPTSYNASGLPQGLAVNTTTGLISGAPTQSGTFNVTLSATNAQGTGNRTLVLNVQGPPTITNAPLAATTMINTPFNFTYTTTGYPAPNVTLTAGAFPNFLSLSSAGVINGTPTQAGAFAGTVTASNGVGTATQNFAITVVQPPAITSTALSGTMVVGTPVSFNCAAGGYPAPTFSLESGLLPSGLNLSTTGLLSGTPNTVGKYSGQIDATNGIGSDAMQTFNLTVQNTLATWDASYFNSTQLGDPSTSGPNANPAHDGVPNLLKYLFDISPLVNMNANDRSMLPKAQIVTVNSVSYLVLNFRQNPYAGSITINLQTSPDLQTWTTVTPDLNRTFGTDVATGDPIEQLGVKLTSAPASYLRLNVTSP